MITGRGATYLHLADTSEKIERTLKQQELAHNSLFDLQVKRPGDTLVSVVCLFVFLHSRIRPDFQGSMTSECEKYSKSIHRQVSRSTAAAAVLLHRNAS